MKKVTNIAIVGLGQIGLYLYNELRLKKKEIEEKTGKKIKVVSISAKNKNKKRKFRFGKRSLSFCVFKEQEVNKKIKINFLIILNLHQY